MSKHNFNRSFAIILGINNYENGIPALETAVPDALKLAEIIQEQHQKLKQQYQAQNKYEVHLLLNQRVTLKKLNQLIEAFKKGQIFLDNEEVTVNNDDRVLFYFAGHGIALEALDNQDGPVGYLIPQDATLGDSNTYLPMQELHDALNALPCRHMLAILDCCFAGAFRWASLKRGIVPKVTVYKERYDRFISDAAWQVITSAADDQKALDSLGQRGKVQDGNEVHSPFAKALFDALRGGADEAADFNEDCIITATELYSYLRDKIEILTENHYKRQTPGLCPLKKHDKGEFIFLLPNFDRDKLADAPPLNVENNPYRGLQSYDEKDSGLFFGRENLIKQLYQRVVSNKQALTVVLGASGTGKSSLMKAGLLPRLRQNSEYQFQILDPMRPGESPLKALAQVCLPANTITAEELAKDEQALANIVERWSQTNPKTKLLLPVDHFEELITLCKSDEEREQFQKLIKNAIARSATPNAIAKYPQNIHVVITLRLDFEAQFQTSVLKDFWNDDTRFVVPPMTQDEFRSCIEKPASEKVVYFDPPSLVDELINEVVQMPGALPLLSFTLSELYLKYLEKRRDNRALTKEDYEELGRVVGFLTKRANQEYERLVAEDVAYKDTIRRVMLRMISLQGGELARRQVPKSELVYPDQEKNKRMQTAIKRFSDARLIVEGSNSQGEAYVEPAHDALVKGWDKLLAWKKEDEENLILQRRLTPAAEEWKTVTTKLKSSGWQTKAENVIDWLDRILYVPENLFNKVNAWLIRRWQQRQNQQKSSRDKPIQFLWNGNPYLDVLNEELQSNNNWFNQLEAEFVQKSVLQKRRNISWRWRIAIGVILGLSGLTITALIGQRNAQIGQIRASQQAAKAFLLPGNQQLEALVAALRAEKTLKYNLLLQLWRPDQQSSKQEVGNLSNIFYQTQERNRLQHQNLVVDIFSAQFSPDGKYIITASGDGTARVWNLQGELLTELKGHRNTLWSAKFSPDSKYIVTASADKTARVWNLQGQLLTELKGSQYGIQSVQFSPDSKYIVTASGLISSNDSTTITSARTARVWNLNGQLLAELKGHKNFVQTAQFSPDSKYIVTASADKTARVWNLQGQLLTELKGHQKNLWSAQFSPDSKYIVTASHDGTARVWNLQGQLLAELKGHKNFVQNAQFSPDSKYIVTASGDRTARVWNLQGQLLTELKGHQGEVRSAQFSSNGKYIITASDDSTAKVWNLNGQLVTDLKGHQSYVYSAQFSPDGTYVVTASRDGTARVWDLQNQLLADLKGHQKEVSSAQFSPDGKYIVTASDDRTARLWNLDGQLLTELKGHQGWLNSAQFSPDAKYIVTASDDRTAKVWNLNGQLLAELKGHRNIVNSAQFSPDGKYIVTASNDSTAKVWNFNGQLLADLKGHRSIVNSAQFSPDGKYIVTASLDKTARVWNLQGQLQTELKKHQNWVRNAKFSPDGKYIVTASSDGTARLWSVQGQLLTELKGHQKGVSNAQFSRDGRYIVTASFDGTARLWSVQGELLAELKGHQKGVPSAQFSPDGKYIVTASNDGTARLWNLQGELLAELKGHQRWLHSVQFSPDGKYIVTASGDQTARIWRIPTSSVDNHLSEVCNQIRSYLKHGSDVQKDDRNLCDGVRK